MSLRCLDFKLHLILVKFPPSWMLFSIFLFFKCQTQILALLFHVCYYLARSMNVISSWQSNSKASLLSRLISSSNLCAILWVFNLNSLRITGSTLIGQFFLPDLWDIFVLRQNKHDCFSVFLVLSHVKIFRIETWQFLWCYFSSSHDEICSD